MSVVYGGGYEQFPRDLPRKPVVIGICPACAGQGHRVDEAGAYYGCERCGSTGDLDEYRLRAAYDCGRQDALADVLTRLGELRVMLGLTIDGAHNPPAAASYRQLRQRIGG